MRTVNQCIYCQGLIVWLNQTWMHRDTISSFCDPLKARMDYSKAQTAAPQFAEGSPEHVALVKKYANSNQKVGI